MKKLIIGIFVTIFVLVLLAVIAVVVVINLSPRKFGLADKEIYEGYTVEDMGIADMRFISIIKDFRKIAKAKNVVKNAYDKEDEKEKAFEIVEQFGFIENGEIQFEKILEGATGTITPTIISYDDTTFAYLFDGIVKTAEQENFEMIKEFNVEISEITFDGTNKNMRVVFGVDIKEIKEAFEKELPGFIAGRLDIPEEIFIVCNYNVKVSNEGIISLDCSTLTINDIDTKLTTGIMLALLNDDIQEEDKVKYIGNEFGDSIETVLTSLGRIGSGEVSNFDLGGTGYQNGKIMMIVGQ